MRDLGLSFAPLVSSLDILPRSWGGYEEVLMVSELVKGHELWRFSDMSRSSLRRGEKWWGYKGVRGL